MRHVTYISGGFRRTVLLLTGTGVVLARALVVAIRVGVRHNCDWKRSVLPKEFVVVQQGLRAIQKDLVAVLEDSLCPSPVPRRK